MMGRDAPGTPQRLAWASAFCLQALALAPACGPLFATLPKFTLQDSDPAHSTSLKPTSYPAPYLPPRPKHHPHTTTTSTPAPTPAPTSQRPGLGHLRFHAGLRGHQQDGV